jgi:hypothetical protein
MYIMRIKNRCVSYKVVHQVHGAMMRGSRGQFPILSENMTGSMSEVSLRVQLIRVEINY